MFNRAQTNLIVPRFGFPVSRKDQPAKDDDDRKSFGLVIVSLSGNFKPIKR
jgi:hypothetical protein